MSCHGLELDEQSLLQLSPVYIFFLHLSSMLTKALYSLNWTARHLTYAYSGAQYWLSGENFLIYLCCSCISLSYILCNSQQHLSRSFFGQNWKRNLLNKGVFSFIQLFFVSFTQISYSCRAETARNMFRIISPSAVFSAWQQSLTAVACIFSISFSAMAKKSSKGKFLWLLRQISLRILSSERDKINCIFSLLSWTCFVVHYFMITVSAIAFYGNVMHVSADLFICSMALCLCVLQFLAKSSSQAKITPPPTACLDGLVNITVFSIENPVFSSFFRNL